MLLLLCPIVRMMLYGRLDDDIVALRLVHTELSWALILFSSGPWLTAVSRISGTQTPHL